MGEGSSGGRWVVGAAVTLALVGAAWRLWPRDVPEAALPEARDAAQESWREAVASDETLREELEPQQQPALPTQENKPLEPLAPAIALWRTLEGEPPPFPGAVEGFVTEKKRVRIDREALSAVEVGARIVFELPDGTRHVALVERLVAHDNGDRTWSGHLAGSGLDHPVVYTQGEPWTFATLVTPQGLYALEAEGEDGVLFKDGREAMQRDHEGCALLPE
ncbi:MAG: hypothetical protein NTV21_04190 [Planctomycetota bacterium]|nr:hypothetical protein [Planctomycetota bacterium]